MAVYNVEVDLASASATASLARTAQQTDDGYELSLSKFISGNEFTIESVDVSPTTVDITYRVSHPFPVANNLDAPATAANRADLGAIMRTLFLIDVPAATGNTYFLGADSAILNSDFVANPSGYFAPRGLITLGPTAVANTFPYQLVVDEAANSGTGNRDGVPGVAGSNGIGNYDALQGGWQRVNMGASKDRWTGFGMLHQGQSATNVLRINRAAITGGSTFKFDSVVIAKYTDPRGGTNSGQKRANRLPTAAGDASAFAYRMPYGALDCETVRFEGETGGLVPNAASSTIVSLHVRDFDASAIETTQTDLALDPNLSFVQRGGSGLPSVSVDIPGVIPAPVDFSVLDKADDDSAFGGDPAADSGKAEDELFFQKAISKPAGSGQTQGNIKGLIRVADAELLDPNRSGYYFAVDIDLQPLPGISSPLPVTYQALSILLANPNGQPVATAGLVGDPVTIPSGGTITAEVGSYTDVESNPGTFLVDFDYTGTFFTDITPVTITTVGPFPSTLGTSAPILNTSSDQPVTKTAQIRYSDPFHPDQTIPVTYTLGGNTAPTADLSLSGTQIVVGSNFNLVVDNAADVEGDSIVYDIDWEWDGIDLDFAPDAPFIGIPEVFAEFPKQASSSVGNYVMGVRVRDALH
ncbi:MAG: hypothetical protein ABI743_13960, partial [bacterium]